MPEASSSPPLLWSLGRLVRGLSALFWGLPLTLLASVETAMDGRFRSVGLWPALAVNLLMLYGLWQLGAFQRQERVWRTALDRARILALINTSLCPYLLWWGRMPGNEFFATMVLLQGCCGVVLLIGLNLVLRRLGDMLPDETLRQETRSFTVLNRVLLVVLLVLVVAYGALRWWPEQAMKLGDFFLWVESLGWWVLIFLGLLPLAMTMAMIWKAKEVILDSVFNATPAP